MRNFISCALVLTGAGSLHAGTYNQNFTGKANGVRDLADGSYVASLHVNAAGQQFVNDGTASVQGERLRLTQNLKVTTNALYRLPDIDPGLELTGFHMEFDMALTSSNPADGFSLNFGGLPLTDAYGPGEEGYQLPGGLVISFDTYINNPPETTRTLDVRVDGNQLVSLAESAFGSYRFNGTVVHVVLHWDEQGLDMTFGSFTVCNNLAVPGLVPQAGDRFAFTARTGGATEDVFLDNIAITTTPTSPVTRPNLAISEMVLVNEDGHQDEHSEATPWVEIYNGTPAPVSLDGWSLTDDANTPAKWAFPAGTTIPSLGYQVVYFGHASPPLNPDTRLHTNFVPSPEGGYLGLFQGNTQVDSFTNYPAQAEDISYGHMGQAWTLGFIEKPSPGTKNTGLQEAGPPVSEEVAWSREGGIITGATPVTIAAPAVAGGQIRYTTDNTEPTLASTLYNHAAQEQINVTARTNLRARIFAPGRLPGAVTSRSFLKIDTSLTNYRGTGQPFSSNLPIVLIDSFGRSIDAENSVTPGARPYRYTYAMVLDRDPASANRTVISPSAPVHYQGRSGMHVRGESSAGMPQRQYAWETLNENGNDEDVSLLGMPAESDWALYAPATDKTLLRNVMAYDTMYNTNGESSAMRTRYVEVFFNQPVQGGTAATDASPDLTYGDYRGVYVLVERIKRGNDRVDIANLKPSDTDPSVISGGYIFKKDKASTDPDFTTTQGQILQIVEPETTVNDPHWTWLRNHVNQFEAALYGANYTNPDTGYRAFIDEQSFMDNQWWVEIFKQIDGYRLSTYFYKDRGQKIKSAPLWDYNLSGGNAHYLEGYKYQGWYHTLVGGTDYQYYGRLRQDPGYTLRHWDRYWKLRATTFNTANVMNMVDGKVKELTDNQPQAIITNGTGTWPNSTPSVEVPAARHHARWQRLGLWDWPNAPGFTNRSRYTNATDLTDYTTHTTTPYAVPASSADGTINGQGTASPAMSEVVHLKAHMTNRLNWIDNAFLSGTTILRPPVLSKEGGNVPAAFDLTITPYTGTPPPNNTYATGIIYYTLDGTDPASTAPSPDARHFVTDENPCIITIPPSAAAETDTAGKNWKDVDFNHLSVAGGVTWYSGLNGVGFDSSPTPVNFLTHVNMRLATAANPSPGMPTMVGVNQTCFVRLPFTLTAEQLAGINRLRLYGKFDDGFIVHLNGVKIAERSQPAVPAWNSGATAARDDSLAVTYDNVTVMNTAEAIAALRVGANVLAIQGMNNGVSSSDFLQRWKLDGEISTVKTYTAPIPVNNPVTVKARLQMANGSWTPLTEATYVVNVDPVSASNLVVSEMMYNPPAPTVAEAAAGFDNDNMFEYLEVQNISNRTIDLSGLTVSNGFTFTWPSDNPALRLLAAGERAVMVGNAGAFAMRYQPGAGVKVAGVFDGNLANGGERIALSTSAGVIKDFSYDDNAPWPVEADGLGHSLVLNNPAANPDHALPQNWRASSGAGGTPGAASGPAGPTGSAAEALADTDGDGIADLIEYATGTLGVAGAPPPALTPATVSLIVPPATEAADYLIFEYVRSRSADGFSFDPETASVPGTWEPAVNLFTLESQTGNPDGTATLRWRSKEPSSTLPSRLFFRVRAGIAP